MYYENKKAFYLKQYGPAALLVCIALILIGIGIYVAVKPNDTKNVIASNPVSINEFALSDKAFTAKVTSVNNLCISVKDEEGIESELYLIGIKQNKRNTKLSSQISSDLVGKNVIVDFDEVIQENGKTYAYVYLDNDVLYNQTILAEGLAELRAERNNINKLDVLLTAQLDAKHDALGIWSY